MRKPKKEGKAVFLGYHAAQCLVDALWSTYIFNGICIQGNKEILKQNPLNQRVREAIEWDKKKQKECLHLRAQLLRLYPRRVHQ